MKTKRQAKLKGFIYYIMNLINPSWKKAERLCTFTTLANVPKVFGSLWPPWKKTLLWERVDIHSTKSFKPLFHEKGACDHRGNRKVGAGPDEFPAFRRLFHTITINHHKLKQQSVNNKLFYRFFSQCQCPILVRIPPSFPIICCHLLCKKRENTTF